MADIIGRHRKSLDSEPLTIGEDHKAGLWLYVPTGKPVLVNGSTETGEKVPGFDHAASPRCLHLLPLPLKRRPPLWVEVDGRKIWLEWPSFPERLPTKHTPQNEDEKAGHELLLRARTVWDRLRDVDSALGDPAHFWENLRGRWTSEDHNEPQMDVIVRHALRLRRIIDELDRAPRRILRRTNQQVPLSRVQELDRRSMTWLVRQPGTSLAERAGARQAILAVTREENFDTLENRVLRAYAELAWFITCEYLARNGSKRTTRRALLVDEYGRRCKRLARDLSEKGVRIAEPGVMPNFVLQQNLRYHKVWDAWEELVKRERENDELWRWQARSWEEFCALAVMVSLVGVSGAKLIASAPLSFRDEQRRGRWVDHDNPLGAFYLEKQGIVVEVRFALERPGTIFSDFGAPIWVSVGRTGDVEGFLSNIAVWPIWDQRGGLVPAEANELRSVLQLGKKARMGAALVIRPTVTDGDAEFEGDGSALTISLGAQGASLHRAIDRMSEFFSSLIIDGTKL